MGESNKDKKNDNNESEEALSEYTSLKLGSGEVEELPADEAPVPERDVWASKLDFLLSCIGYAVGLGNIWRFPYLCYKNGGGAFLIPYFACLLMSGIPMFLLEVSLGQFMARGCIRSWQICPLFQGIGYATTVICSLCNLYYIVILAWGLYYLFKSFTTELPWATCGNPWNTDACIESKDEGSRYICLDSIATNGSNWTEHQFNWTNSNDTDCANMTDGRIPSAQEFWENKVLQMSDGIDEIGTLVWPLVLCLFLAWVMVYFIIWKGVRSSGKVVYFTATFPYVVLTIMLIRGLTLPGAGTGLLFYLSPDLSRLRDAQVWVDAGSQIFYSFAVGFGSLTALGSYNKFHNNCYRDTLIVTTFNCLTSLYGGLVIFSVLGFMAYEQQTTVGEVASKGPGLAFIAYPKALSLMPAAPLWSCLFFLMILLVGLDSQFVAMEGLITALIDIFPRLRGGYRREIFTLFICFATFLAGLIFVTNAGIYLFKVFEYYSANFPLFFVGALESVVIAWVYGADRFVSDLEYMIGYRPFVWFKICWKYLIPLVATAILVFALANHTAVPYNDYTYPMWAVLFGWFLSVISVILIPISICFLMLRTEGGLVQRWRFLTTPRLQPHQQRPATAKGMVLESKAARNMSRDEKGTHSEKEQLEMGIEKS